jgi:hypothetical protein
MNERFTLVYLVNQIKSELRELSYPGLTENDPEVDSQDSFVSETPSSKTVQAILNYARLLEVADTESVGKVEWMLN